jgi:hypothetical protein
MPVATVNENYRFIFWKDKIRLPRKLRSVNSISKTSGVERCAKEFFWLRVLATNTSHHPRARCLVHYVNHFTVLSLEQQVTQCHQV